MSNPGLPAIGVNFAITAATVAVLMLSTLAIAVRRRRHDTIDTVWGLGFAVIAVISFGLSTSNGAMMPRLVVLAMTVIWGVRLAVHLHLRNSGRDEDPRYQEILTKAKGNPIKHMLRMVYLPQGAVMWLVSLPVQVAPYGASSIPITGYLGLAVWLIGISFESIGDAQLRRFITKESNRGKVLDTGLWRYTRHPNYFGDACVWWGLYLVATHSVIGICTVISPVLMTFLLVRGTGKPLLERGMARTRPGYADYVRRTSGFFPLPPRRHDPRGS